MKKILFPLCMACYLCTGAEPAPSPGISPEVRETLLRYQALHICMYKLLITLHDVQDAAGAAANAAAVQEQLYQIKEITTDLDDPYRACGNTDSKAEKNELSHQRLLMQEVGQLLEQEIIRLAQAEYYGSKAFIQALQNVGILDSRANKLMCNP